MLPTEVHERYLVLVLPFIGLCTVLSRRLWPALVMLVIVMMGQMSWPLWLHTPPGAWAPREQQIKEAHAQTMARLPADARQRVRSLAEVLEAQHAEYRRARAGSVGFEWVLTILALVATGWTLAVYVTAKPDGGAGLASGEGDVRTKAVRGRAHARPRTGE